MNFRRLIIAIAIIAVAASCKKDKDSAVTPSLEGYLTIKGLPEYISPEAELSFEAHGVSHPDGGALGYAWSVVPGMETADRRQKAKQNFSASRLHVQRPHASCLSVFFLC